MIKNLLDPALMMFVFGPLGTVTLLLYAIVPKRSEHDCDGLRDLPAAALAWFVATMPNTQAEWGQAMLAELATVPRGLARWSFALGCARVAIFPPCVEPQPAEVGRNPLLGVLAIALPLLGLPLLYAAAAILEAINGSPFTSSRSAEAPLAIGLVKLLLGATVACLVAGLPLGFAARWRRERFAHLTAWGMVASVCMSGYFLVGMHWLAGGE